jgi:hypothetical protein
MGAEGVPQREVPPDRGAIATVRRMLGTDGQPRNRRARRSSMVEPFEPAIRRVFERWPELKAPRMTELLRAHGYEGSVDWSSVACASCARQKERHRPAHRLPPRPGAAARLGRAADRPRDRRSRAAVYAVVGSLAHSGAQSAHFSFDMTLQSFLEGQVRTVRLARACSPIEMPVHVAPSSRLLITPAGWSGKLAPAPKMTCR